ncbi:MAG TPA: hypothetical protein VHQ89_01445 [Gaiellaceae bacterium]|nr:hypothetical protein [Gaiellaceae bacterium]
MNTPLRAGRVSGTRPAALKMPSIARAASAIVTNMSATILAANGPP